MKNKIEIKNNLVIVYETRGMKHEIKEDSSYKKRKIFREKEL